MSVFPLFSMLIVVSAAFAYVNFRFIKLPWSIGLMLMALISSLIIFGVGEVYPAVTISITAMIHELDFSRLLMGSMLSFMLFAGAIHIKLEDLRPERFSVIIFSTCSVLLSTFIVGILVYYLLALFGMPVDFVYCLLFGSLISPTDPIAVLGILKEAKISKSLETKMAGESLFNDGVAVVVFVTLLEVAEQPGNFKWTNVIGLFLREACGGLLWGVLIGYLGFLLMRSINNYKVEVMITLAIVMGGYSFASMMHISGPLAMVAAGIIIGNQAKNEAVSDKTAEYIDKFWELIDEILNAMLFVLIGFELLIVNLHFVYILIGLISIIIVLLSRYVSVLLPAQIVKLKERVSNKTILILTWGGLRGGISIALALSIKPEMHKDLWVTLTYVIVAFSILVQGLTIGRFAKRLNK
ncbi:MAG: sodium:proton antiporter [Ferruginibacter sp.]